MVLLALMLPKVTVPGPLTLDQLVVCTLPTGKPSSLTTLFRLAEAGRTSF